MGWDGVGWDGRLLRARGESISATAPLGCLLGCCCSTRESLARLAASRLPVL